MMAVLKRCHHFGICNSGLGPAKVIALRKHHSVMFLAGSGEAGTARRSLEVTEPSVCEQTIKLGIDFS